MNELYWRTLTGIALALVTLASLLFAPAWVFALFVASIALLILIYEWPVLFKTSDPLFWLLMPFYPILPLFLIIYLQVSGYESLNLLTIAMVSIHDTGSYLIGKKWGKHKINEKVSPKKSWEGFIGGTLCALCFALMYFWQDTMSTSLIYLVPFTLLLCSSALTGDLFESYLKRRAGIKDTGYILPGHGGFLDRLDGILFATIIIFILRNPLSILLAQQ